MDIRANDNTRSQGSGTEIQPAPSTSRFIEAGGLRLHYLDYGTGGRRPMLCVHGGGAHAHWYDFVASGFSADHHVRAVDLRGHGDSPWADPPDYAYERFAADLAEAVEKLDLHDFVLIGHSMGGMISLVYSASYPGRVSRLVVIDSNLRINPAIVMEMRTQVSSQASTYPSIDELAARYRLRPEGTTASPETIRHLGTHAGRQVADGKWQHKFDRNVYAKRMPVDGMSCWNRIKIPALIVKGSLSGRVTPEIFTEVKTRCPQVELADIADSRHHVTIDQPASFVREVRAFLGRHA